MGRMVRRRTAHRVKQSILGACPYRRTGVHFAGTCAVSRPFPRTARGAAWPLPGPRRRHQHQALALEAHLPHLVAAHAGRIRAGVDPRDQRGAVERVGAAIGVVFASPSRRPAAPGAELHSTAIMRRSAENTVTPIGCGPYGGCIGLPVSSCARVRTRRQVPMMRGSKIGHAGPRVFWCGARLLGTSAVSQRNRHGACAPPPLAGGEPGEGEAACSVRGASPSPPSPASGGGGACAEQCGFPP